MKKIFISAIFISIVILLGGSAAESVEPQWIDATHMFDKEVAFLSENVKLETKHDFAARTRAPEPKPKDYIVGDVETFWTKNIKENKFEQIQATLKVIGSRCYVFVQNGKTVSDKAVNRVKDTFDSNVYPTNTQTFGQEWSPGIDGDKRITLLMLDIQDGFDGKGGFVAGYFFAGDEFLQSEIPSNVDVKSNEREMFYLDINPADPDKPTYMSVVAHEFQHMIHFNHDKKELTWVNEACSQIAPYLCGFGHANQIMGFIQLPDNSMTAWAKDQLLSSYGQVYLWNYFLMNRYLKDKKSVQSFFSKLVDDKSQGIAGYEKALKPFNITFSEAFTDFAITNFVNDPKLEKGKFAYDKSLGRLRLPVTNLIKTFPGQFKDQVFLWSADGIRVDLSNAKKTVKVEFGGALLAFDPKKTTNFVVAAVLLDSSDKHLPSIQYLKVSPVSDKRMQVGALEIPRTEEFDTLMLVISAQAPTSIPDAGYAKAPAIPYVVRVTDSGEVVASNNSRSRNTRSFFADYAAASKRVADSQEKVANQALETLDELTFEITRAVREQLDNNSMKTVDELISSGANEASRSELRPLAKKVAQQLYAWKAQENGRVDQMVDQKIEALKSF